MCFHLLTLLFSLTSKDSLRKHDKGAAFNPSIKTSGHAKFDWTRKEKDYRCFAFRQR